MNANEIIEGNKLIAAFMGLDVLYGTHVHHETTDRLKVAPMKYHSSWDWLMPVVEKIESVHFESTDNEVWVDVLIQSETCHIIEETSQFKTIEKIGTKIEATWLAVVEFIKWYNQNKES